ncbi:Kelch-like H-associated protein 1 [Homalodisca vitripennis]|nr:Kelch-like H-associated protein 1 [Homalodisca vitripennis]
MDGEEDYSSKPGDTARGQDTNDMTFVINSYLKDAMKIMNMMRSHNLLTDIILEVGSESFQAHKVVLAAASPYFKKTLKMPESLDLTGLTKHPHQSVTDAENCYDNNAQEMLTETYRKLLAGCSWMTCRNRTEDFLLSVA